MVFAVIFTWNLYVTVEVVAGLSKNAMVIFYASGHGFTNGQAVFARAANNTNGFLGFSSEL